ncbi:MAG: cation:proton antiporter [Spirochaetia bacterium]|jgi:Kef-type K+ transport system membrane component KefB
MSILGPIALIVFWVAIILVTAKLGAEIALRVGQPPVLGELIVGIVLGNLGLLGFHALDAVKTDAVVNALAQIGVLILVFTIGLRSTIAQMIEVGTSSLLAAVLGVAVPFALGWGVSAWLLPDASPYVHLFLGAAITATGVAVIGRALHDIGLTHMPEARVIMGAAVIDDIIGFIILATLSGLISAVGKSAFSLLSVGIVTAKALGFLAGALIFGRYLFAKLLQFASKLKGEGILLLAGIAFCFIMSFLASLAGLEPVIGAFAAGLSLEERHYRSFLQKGDLPLEESIKPIAATLVPIFFVLMGMRTDLKALSDPGILGFAALLTAVAVMGKLASGLGVLGKGVDRLTVGIGMVPRGAVGLIFAGVGLTLSVEGLPIVTPSTFSALVIMVILTTLVALPLMKRRMDLLQRRRETDHSRRGKGAPVDRV